MENWEVEQDLGPEEPVPEKELVPEEEPVLADELSPEAPPAPEEGEEQSGARARKEASDGKDLYLNMRVLVTMMSVFVLMFTFAARIIVVSGPSMENTLINGDLMLVWSVGYKPAQGDVVVLTQESYQEDSIVKRVIATEGQQVDIDYNTSTVYVDGMPLGEDYIKERMYVPAWGEGLNHLVVPEGCIFVMGDNRNHSADSRLPDIGIVDTRCVIGHGLAVIFPFHHWKGL